MLTAPISAAAAQSEPAVGGSAQSWFEFGLARSQVRDWDAALDAFHESLAREPRVSTYYNVAVAALELGQPDDSLAALDAFDSLADPAAHADYLQEAATLRERAAARVGTIRLSAEPTQLSLRLDGVSLAPSTAPSRMLYLQPGHHTLRGEAPGYIAQGFGVSVEAGDSLDMDLVLAVQAPERTPPSPSARRDTRRNLRIWSIAGASALAVAAIITGVTLALRSPSSDDNYAGSSGLAF